ncbi:Protein YIPF1-like [Porphyridium purpureum]|uniref:Protein YIPF n=1 Tax=Porphyridium purpureum TaxID=35688 RepID=A0A5J4YJE3_PORPP|nr:Protein YIPF1-like [Porphyridium purpureum]|eukprot:POR0728..scf289_17
MGKGNPFAEADAAASSGPTPAPDIKPSMSSPASSSSMSFGAAVRSHGASSGSRVKRMFAQRDAGSSEDEEDGGQGSGVGVSSWARRVDDDARGEPKVWQLRFYQQYFDLTMSEFLMRVLWAIIPCKPIYGWATNPEDADAAPDENPDPDLYAPIWLTTTLVLLLSVLANIAVFFRNLFQMHNAVELGHSGVDIRNLWLAACIMYGYVFLVPLVFFVLQPCAGVSVPFVNTVCVYGYSLAPVIVASLVCIVPITLVQLIAMGTGFIVSTWFVMFNVWRAQSVEHKSLAYFAKLLSGILHAALGCVLTFLFFVR